MRHPFLSLFNCPICSSPLCSPVTLPCGHTLCKEHYAHPCPIPTCTYNARSSSSRVSYFPPQHLAVSYITSLKVDVTVNKVFDLLSQPLSTPEARDCNRVHNLRNDDTTENEDEDLEDSDISLGHRPNTSPSESPRPRKRRRRWFSIDAPDQPEEDLVEHLRLQSVRQREVPRDVPLLSAEEFSTDLPTSTVTRSMTPSPDGTIEKQLLVQLTCEICYMLLYQPITTPCQHTFCYKCLHRWLDHRSACPLCREKVPGYAYFLDHPCNKLLLALIAKAFPSSYEERGNAIAAEERDARLKTPILVGPITFPGMPTVIHIFEPRYRLMLRRCLDGPSPRFGVMPPQTTNPSQGGGYGTIVMIQSVKMFPDGRSLLETIGAQRFRILERGTLDGYTVARTEMVEDYPDELDDQSSAPPSPTLPGSSSIHPSTPAPLATGSDAELASICRKFLIQMQQGFPWVGQRINSTYGEPPSDIESLSYYVASVLPINDQEKAKLLPIRTSSLRLRLVVHWIEQLSDNWWFTGGCIIL